MFFKLSQSNLYKIAKKRYIVFKKVLIIFLFKKKLLIFFIKFLSFKIIKILLNVFFFLILQGKFPENLKKIV